MTGGPWTRSMKVVLGPGPNKSGAPNDPVFPNTSEMSQMVFSMLWKLVWLIWSCPKYYLSVWMS